MISAKNLILCLALPLLLVGCRESPEDLFTKGKQALSSGNLPDAVTYLKRAVKASPNALDAMKLLGGTYYRLGEMDQSAELFDEVLTIAPNDLTALEARGRIAGNLGHWRDANTFFTRAVTAASDPQDISRIQTAWGMADDLRGDTMLAAARLLFAIRANATNEVALYNLAVLFKEKLNLPRESAELFNLYLRTDGSAVREAPAKKALDSLKTLIQKSDSTRSRLIAETKPLAEKAIRERQPRKAAELYRILVSLGLDEKSTLEAAKQAYQTKNYDIACHLLLPLCYHSPRNLIALDLMTRACYACKHYPEARLYGQRCLALIPEAKKAKYDAWLQTVPMARND